MEGGAWGVLFTLALLLSDLGSNCRRWGPRSGILVLCRPRRLCVTGWIWPLWNACKSPFRFESSRSNPDYRESQVGRLEGNICTSDSDNLNDNWALFRADLLHHVRCRPYIITLTPEIKQTIVI